MMILKSLRAEVAEQAFKAKQNKADLDGRVLKTKQVLHHKATSPQALLACAATGAAIGSLVTRKTKTKSKIASRPVASPGGADDQQSRAQHNRSSSTPTDTEARSVLSQIADKLLAQSTEVMINLFTVKITEMATDAVKKKQQNSTNKFNQDQT